MENNKFRLSTTAVILIAFFCFFTIDFFIKKAAVLDAMEQFVVKQI